LRINNLGSVGIKTTPNSLADLHVADTSDARIWLEATSGNILELYAGTGVSIFNRSNNFLNFGTNNAERMRLTNTGSLLIGHTTDDDTNGISASSTTSFEGHSLFNDGQMQSARNGTVMELNRLSTNGTVLSFRGLGTQRGSVSVSAYGVAYNTTSDQRLKDNIQDAGSASTAIDNIKVRQFDWKADGTHQDYGMIAQELATVVPDAVSSGDKSTDMMGVDYSKIVPLLVKEIQELRQRVAQLEE